MRVDYPLTPVAILEQVDELAHIRRMIVTGGMSSGGEGVRFHEETLKGRRLPQGVVAKGKSRRYHGWVSSEWDVQTGLRRQLCQSASLIACSGSALGLKHGERQVFVVVVRALTYQRHTGWLAIECPHENCRLAVFIANVF